MKKETGNKILRWKHLSRNKSVNLEFLFANGDSHTSMRATPHEPNPSEIDGAPKVHVIGNVARDAYEFDCWSASCGMSVSLMMNILAKPLTLCAGVMASFLADDALELLDSLGAMRFTVGEFLKGRGASKTNHLLIQTTAKNLKNIP